MQSPNNGPNTSQIAKQCHKANGGFQVQTKVQSFKVIIQQRNETIEYLHSRHESKKTKPNVIK